ncbi:MAG TPA: 1-acyl-sn-glycerol-3-phosphate acyltransferase [Candidatus Saccharimonadales bacterium]
MEMPELVPDNHEAIYEYFRDFEPNKRIQDYGFAIMHALYASEVHYHDGSGETIQGLLEDGGSVILSPNHHSNADTPTIAGLVYEDAFATLKGTTIIPAKAEMFRWPLLEDFSRTCWRILLLDPGIFVTMKVAYYCGTT